MCGIQTKWKQAFYDDVEPMRLKDPLAVFLGAIDENEDFIFTYTDAVKLAGHSCPAVSGAYKLTQKALEALYPNETPVRGNISVKVLGSIDNGANGPISQVISLITGAAPQTGFAGLAGEFVRKDKLVFDEQNEESSAFIFTRDDNGKSVKVMYHLEHIPQKEEMSGLFSKCISGTANEKQKEKFKELWQAKVKAVLFEEVKNLFTVEKLT